MGLFDAISTADTGVNVSQTWMDAISDNIANVNTVRPTSQAAFQARFVDVAPIQGAGAAAAGSPASAAVGSGAEVTGVSLGSAQGILRYDPSNPMADSQGMVRAPDVDLGQQMTQMIMAERGYQANIATVARATAAYQAALGLKL